MNRFAFLISLSALSLQLYPGADPGSHHPPEKSEIIPLPDHQVSFQIDGLEKTRWHFDEKYPRPFFYPFNGPSGVSLTRMGHPGAQNHDHHRSIWFAHNQVNGLDFWADGKGPTIRQKFWYRYRDGNEEAIMASALGWYDAEGTELMEQDLVVAAIPLENNEHLLEIQITLRPAAGQEKVELGKTNFGFLAVRVAKTISNYFGGGQLTNEQGQAGEPTLFGQPSRWMDYSGHVVAGVGENRQSVEEGITYFDHPENPRYPTAWHVRSDGWMGASFCLKEGYRIDAGSSLTLRYLLHAHGGSYDAKRASSVAKDFEKRPGFEFTKSNQANRQFEVWRIGSKPEAEE